MRTTRLLRIDGGHSGIIFCWFVAVVSFSCLIRIGRAENRTIGSFVVDDEVDRRQKPIDTDQQQVIAGFGSDSDRDWRRGETQLTTAKRENGSELIGNSSSNRNVSIRWPVISTTTIGAIISTTIESISSSTTIPSTGAPAIEHASPNLTTIGIGHSHQNDIESVGSKSHFHDLSSSSSIDTELPSLRFDSYIQTHPYRSDVSLSYDDRGMWMLYEATNWFLDKLQPDQFPDYLLSDDDLQNVRNVLLALQRNHAQWIRYEQGFIITGGICFLLAALFTLCYLVYACCRCCCPQSTEEKVDRKRDPCKRHFANVLLAVLALLMTFAVACSCITNHYVHVAVTDLPNNLRTSVDDVALYRDDTDQRIQKLLIQDFRTLNSTIANTLDSSSHVVIERVKQVTGAISLDHLATIADRAVALSNKLGDLETSMGSIRQDALKLRTNLTRLRDWASSELQACLNNAFDAASDQKRDCETALSVLDSYKDIPDSLDEETSFTSVKTQLGRLAAYNLSALLQGPRSQFETLKLRFHEKITSDKQAVTQRMNDLGNDLVSIATNISRRLQRIDVSHAKSMLDKYESEASPYEYYRWIGGHVISVVLGVMVICFGLGLFFGVCGRRPSYYDDDCCVWPRGGKLYCCGIVIGVLCSFVFMLIVIAVFLIGGNGQEIVCKSLKSPTNQNGFMNLVKRYSNMVADDLARTGGNPDIREIFVNDGLSKLISGCAENKTLYRLLDFDRRYRLTNLKEVRSEAFRQLDSYVQQLQDVDLETSWTRLIPPEAEATLREIESHSIAPLPSRVIDELFINATAVLDFTEKINTLKKVKSSSLGGGGGSDRHDELQRVLRTIVPELEQMKDTAESMRHRLLSVAENLTSLNEQIPQLTKDVPNWVLIAKNAQGLLASNLTGYARVVAADLVKRLRTYVDEYLQHISNQLDTEVSSCEPLVRAADAVYISACNHVLQPLNAFWASVGIFLLLSIPAMVLASALRDLYTNTDAYVSTSCSVPELVPFLYNGATDSRSRRNGRVTAFTTDCYDHYSRVNGTAHPKCTSGNNGSTNWRTPSFENVGSPPPPYQSPRRQRRRR